MTASKTVAIGCDEAAVELKETISDYVCQLGHTVEDLGVHRGETILYPDIAFAVANAVRAGRAERGILMCGTGIGVAMSANKVPGIRAAQAHDTYSAERARKSNDAHIVTLGGRVVGSELAKAIVIAFLSSEFAGGGSAEKVDRIKAYERELEEQRGSAPAD